MSDLGAKFVENFFKDRFSRPFMRRLRYMYFGLDHQDDVFVLSDTEDMEFKYCSPMQTTGLVKITNKQQLDAIKEWLGKILPGDDTPMLLYFGTMVTLFGKTSWMSPDISFRRTPEGAVLCSVGPTTDVLIARPCDAHFALTKMQGYVTKYDEVFFKQSSPSLTIKLPGDTAQNKIQRLPVSCETINEAGIVDVVAEDFNLVLLPGLDVLLDKSLLQKDAPSEDGVRLWADSSSRCLNFGGYHTDPDISLCVVRDNIFVFPRMKPEQEQ